MHVGAGAVHRAGRLRRLCGGEPGISGIGVLAAVVNCGRGFLRASEPLAGYRAQSGAALPLIQTSRYAKKLR